MKRRDLTIGEKSTIFDLHNAKVPRASIARQLGMPKTIVYTIFKNFHIQGTIQSLKSTERPPRLSACDKEFEKILMQK